MNELAKLEVGIFQRGGMLVRPVTEDEGRDADGNPVRISKLIKVESRWLKTRLSDDLCWQKWENDQIKIVNCGDEMPQLVLSQRGEWPFPQVSGLINAPTLRADGSALNKEGYDAATGLLLINVPAVPINLRPTRPEALRSLSILKDLLREVPFKEDTDRAVVMSLIISTLLCGAIECTPLHMLVSPTPGSGKSFIVDIASMIATGMRCSVVAATKNTEEFEKRIATELMQGQALISLDNLTGVLSSDLLCQAVTQSFVSIRKFGSNDESRQVRSRAVFAATGNNLVIADDLERRTLMAQIDAEMEKPWERQFKQKPLKMIAKDRARYIAAALTIPLAYVAAGCPEQAPEVNGFDQWSRFVRSALMWLDEADPAVTMQTARGANPKLQAKAAVLSAMANLFGLGQDRSRTTSQIITEATDPAKGRTDRDGILNSPMGLGAKEQALKEALMEVAGAGKEINSRRLGNWLRDARKQIVGGFQLCCEEDTHLAQMRWWVEVK